MKINKLKRIGKLTLLTVFSLSLCFFVSCSNEENKLDTTTEVIKQENLEILKRQSLEEFNSLYLFNTIYSLNIDFKKAHEKLNSYNDAQLVNLDFESALGEDYNKEYFDKLDVFLNFSIRIINSNLFYKNSSLQSREKIVSEVLYFVLCESEKSNYMLLSCGPGYNPCMNRAKKAHGVRMTAATATGALGMALTGWTGIGAAASGGGWVIAVVASGVLYQVDSEYCTEAHCN